MSFSSLAQTALVLEQSNVSAAVAVAFSSFHQQHCVDPIKGCTARYPAPAARRIDSSDSLLHAHGHRTLLGLEFLVLLGVEHALVCMSAFIASGVAGIG